MAEHSWYLGGRGRRIASRPVPGQYFTVRLCSLYKIIMIIKKKKRKIRMEGRRKKGKKNQTACAYNVN